MSIDLKKGTWYDHESGTGGGVIDLVARENKIDQRRAAEWLHEHGFIAGNGNGNGHTEHEQPHSRIVAAYDYRDENGTLLSQAVRFEPKDFRQRRPDASEPSGWTWKTRGVRRVPYRLPELIEALANDHLVFIVEGEKDVDLLWRNGVPATTNAGGAGKWDDELNAHFAGADVVIIPDNDPQKRHPKTNEPMFHPDGKPVLPGQDHAVAIANALKPIAARVRLLDLSKHWTAMPPKGDVANWLDAGGTPEQLYALVEQTPVWGELPITTVAYILPDPATIPPRGWLYGRHYMRGVVTSTVAPGGFGKTTLALYEALTMVVENGLRVWYVSGEDDRVELDRRIAAHCKERWDGKQQREEITNTHLAGRFFLDDKLSFPFKIARTGKAGIEFDEVTLVLFERTIRQLAIDVVILDPLISFHMLSENDTAAMDAMVKRLGEITARNNCCIELSHHVRKPSLLQSEITVYDARGAAALVNATRSCRVLNHMSENEAAQVGVETDRTAYIRIDGGKRNMAPPESANWSRLVGITIANSDFVQAIETYNFVVKSSTTDDDDWCRIVVSQQEFRTDTRSEDWLGHAVAKHFGRNSADTADIRWIQRQIKRWLDNNIIRKVTRKDETRRPRQYFEVIANAPASGPAPMGPAENDQ